VKNQWLDVEVGYGLLEERDAFDPAQLAARWRSPALIFHGSEDDTVPVQGSREFVRAAACPDVELRVIEGGDHRLHGWKEEMAEGACRFFAPFWPDAGAPAPAPGRDPATAAGATLAADPRAGPGRPDAPGYR